MKRIVMTVSCTFILLSAAQAAEVRPCDTVAYRDTGSADYAPGVDAAGHALVPADLTGQNDQNAHILDNSSVDLELPLSGYTDISPYSADLSQAHVNAGSIWLKGKDPELNGQKLGEGGCPSESKPVPQPKEGGELGS